ncbi:peptidyl-glycine alpha-amidating monooxygenase A-like isoform X1 [Pecten maximus]|uniref:peptidyl-glycine alpha-amidating monooxygenase A-like isoform X1 n=1 Tax=Pecten maximus TaxID=6579 RepID=UPI001458B9AA|nr:peptidyl-glycine alpha-amidating monooxygenase A-like isoform X1 [Pecten maximus]XP_033727114.1 peptidyl-glycine alpha-amidating monooxygenase A-like isoform X1 [Pecten maximus]
MRVLVAVLCVTTVWGYRYFQDEIPNGAAVPHPCKTNFIWWGVGHLNPRGGGSVNPFGEDFKNAGMKWTRALCEMDSDGDGETNGQELGDPDCVWTKGSVAAVTKDISHPGVCTPYSDPACQAANTWIDCKLEDFHCDAFSEEGAKNISLRIPRTVVPPSETSYYCVKFPLPTDVDYHIVGLKPLIDNENVVHHIIMYGCDDSEEAEYNQPEPCGMYTPQCTEFIFGWGLGSNGICLHTGTGVRLGKTGFKKVMLQFHWNNPERRPDYTDNSGINLFYTPHLRLFDSKIFVVGTKYFELPPGQEEVRIDGWCSSECSSHYLTGPLYISKAQNHMHYMGRKQKLQQFRNGVWIRDITNEDTFEYDGSFAFGFDPPIEVLPGDELKTTCVFDSTRKTTTTFEGDGTSDEMCYVFLRVYPAENIKGSYCVSWKDFDLCKIIDFPSKFPVIDGCEMQSILNPFHPDLMKIFSNLRKFCRPFDLCTQECKQYVRDVVSTNKCFSGEIVSVYRHLSLQHMSTLMELWAAIDSCKTDIEIETCQEQCKLVEDSKMSLTQG